MSNQVPYRIYLEQSELPKQWYNIQADMPTALEPYLSSATGKLAGADELGAIFPAEIIAQEVSRERYIDIPHEVRELYASYRSTPLIRAYRLEKALDTPAHIYIKYEGAAPSGSHKFNSALPQAFYNKAAGITRITTETGAGQWGTALSIACAMFQMHCKIYMVKISAQQKPARRAIIETFGGEVIPSPSVLTEAGRKILEREPDCLGSLGIAIAEAVEEAASREDTNYCLGSVLNHVLLHQSIIGLEAKAQLEKADEYPDFVIACCGGGSNFGGVSTPFLHDKFTRGTKTRFIAVEPTACPTLTRGKFAYDYSDSGKVGPMAKMYTLGSDFRPSGIHAGGLRYHGDSPIVSQLYHDGAIEARAVGQASVFQAAMLFARNEGILPAPESAHALRAAIDEALICKQTGEKKTILALCSGHGDFDLAAYEQFNRGEITDAELGEDELQQRLETLPGY